MWDLIVLIPDHCLSIYFSEVRNFSFQYISLQEKCFVGEIQKIQSSGIISNTRGRLCDVSVSSANYYVLMLFKIYLSVFLTILYFN